MSDHDSFREDVKAYIAEDREFKKSLDKIIKNLSDDMWGTGDVNPGVKRKVDSHVEILKNQKEQSLFWRSLLGVPIIGLVVQWIWDFVHKH